MILLGLALWLLSLIAFMFMRRRLLHRRWLITVAATLCFAPGLMVFFREEWGYPLMLFTPLAVAMVSWLLFPPSPNWALFFGAIVDHWPVIALTASLAFLISGRRAVTDTEAPSVNDPVDLGAATGMRRLIEPLIILVALPLVVLATGLYPWRDAPTILRPVPLWLTASVIFICAVIAYLSSSALLGKRRADGPSWKTLSAAFVLFLLLRSFVAVVVFRVLDPARHLPWLQ